jgi:hypothetical protein
VILAHKVARPILGLVELLVLGQNARNALHYAGHLLEKEDVITSSLCRSKLCNGLWADTHFEHRLHELP